MRVTIRGKNLEITAPLREYIQLKIIDTAEHLIKRDAKSDLPIFDIDVERSTKHHRKGDVYRVAVIIRVGGARYSAQAHGGDVHAACDAVEDELKRAIIDRKARSFSLIKRLGRQTKQFLRIDQAAWFRRKKRNWDEGN